MIERYSNLFVASAGASAALIGLLFVALTIANTAEPDHRTRTNRDALAASAFAQLIDALFISIGGLAGDARIFAGVALAAATFGLWTTSRLLPGVVRSGNWAPEAPYRASNIAMPLVSIFVYGFQFALAIGVLFFPSNSALLRLSALVMLGLVGGAIARAWKITKV